MRMIIGLRTKFLLRMEENVVQNEIFFDEKYVLQNIFKIIVLSFRIFFKVFVS